jgi:hypothetical protein
MLDIRRYPDLGASQQAIVICFFRLGCQAWRPPAPLRIAAGQYFSRLRSGLGAGSGQYPIAHLAAMSTTRLTDCYRSNLCFFLLIERLLWTAKWADALEIID